MNPGRLIAIARKEFRQLVRDWRILFILVFLPALLLLIFGYALSFDVRNVPLAVQDFDRTPESRALIEALLGAESFELVTMIERDDEADALLAAGQVDAVLVIPPGYGRAIASGDAAEVQALLDGSNSQAAATTLGYLNAHFATYALGVVTERMATYGVSAAAAPLRAEPRIWFNPELRSSMFLVPGLMVFVLMVSATISTALGVVREKERNTVEQILVSPVRAPELILGKTLPYLLVTLIAAALLVGTGWVLFDVPVRGSLWLLGFASLLFCLCGLGQGLMISSVTDSQQVAFFLAVLSSILPAFILSGFVFPLESAAWGIKVISHVVPARYYLAIARGVIVRGADLQAVWPQLVALTVFAFVILGAASARTARMRLVK